MKISMREVEPFNIPPVDNHQAGMFTRKLTGGEVFEFDGVEKPKSILFYDLKYAYPGHSYAHGWLLSVAVDNFLEKCNSGRYGSMEPILKATVIGSIHIEYGGGTVGTKISARSLKL